MKHLFLGSYIVVECPAQTTNSIADNLLSEVNFFSEKDKSWHCQSLPKDRTYGSNFRLVIDLKETEAKFVLNDNGEHIKGYDKMMAEHYKIMIEQRVIEAGLNISNAVVFSAHKNTMPEVIRVRIKRDVHERYSFPEWPWYLGTWVGEGKSRTYIYRHEQKEFDVIQAIGRQEAWQLVDKEWALKNIGADTGYINKKDAVIVKEIIK